MTFFLISLFKTFFSSKPTGGGGGGGGGLRNVLRVN